MTIHSYTQGEDIAAIRARLELEDGAILHIGAAGAIHFDDAAEQDAYDDRILDEAKVIRRKRRTPEQIEARRAVNRENAKNAGRPKGSKNKAVKATKGGSE